MKRLAGLMAALLLAATPMADASAQLTTLEAFQGNLYAGRTDDAAAALQALADQDPADDQARLALGAVQFIQAVERLAQAMYRHGQRSDLHAFMLPFFRLPVADNLAPEPLTYDMLREILQAFVGDLALAEQTLSGVDDPAVRLPLNIGLVHLDLDGDGAIGQDEALWRVYARIAPMRSFTEEEARAFAIDFDGSDAPWLRGYCHLLMGIAEFFLAHDWREGFERTFHALFPGADLPYAVLLDRSAYAYDVAEFGEIADLVAFLHLIRWPVAEPQRLAATLAHLESMVALSRASWRLVLAETDREREWIPNPAQTGVIPGLSVTEQQVQGWMLFLDEFEALLQGRKLLSHWRLAKGINLRRVFLEPRSFDLVLWVQGSAAMPYLEVGPLSTDETWQTIFELFQGDFFSYAVWFN